MPRGRWTEVLRTANGQQGLVTREQVVAAGFTSQAVDYRIRAGYLTVVHPSVYRIAGAPESWEHDLLAALLAAGDKSWISHGAAGVQWQLEDVTATVPDVLVLHSRRLGVVGVSVHRTRVLRHEDVTTRNGIRVTSVGRTIVDLAGVLTLAHLSRVVDDARRRRIVTLDHLRSALDSRGPNGVRGWGRLDRLVNERLGTEPTGSGKETVFLNGLRRRRLPMPVPQYRIVDHAGRVIARPDFAYPDIKLAIEVDGGHHMDPEQWRADLARQNRMVLEGWRFLRFPRIDRTGQREAFETIERAFTAFGEPDPKRSWAGLPKRAKKPRAARS